VPWKGPYVRVEGSGVVTTPHDPGAEPEDEGIPDLQDGTPEQQRASDPQRMSVPGDQPTIAEFRETTAEEARAGESLDERLADEEPERGAEELAEPEEDLGGPEDDLAGPEQASAGQLSDEPGPDRRRGQDVYSREGSDRGLSAEEDAVRIIDDEEL
jgi:hypothetical protein